MNNNIYECTGWSGSFIGSIDLMTCTQYNNRVNKMADSYSPTSWDRLPGESDEDYEDRVTDQEDWMENMWD